MTKLLHISDSLALPLDAVTQKFAILGTSGSGKTFTAMKMAELMLDADAQIVAIDPVGVWYSLRLAADGKSPGYKQVVVFGGDHGDLPLVTESGGLIGRLLAERRFPAVLDVSHFLTAEMKRFLTAFAEQFFQSKKSHKSPVHLFLEECQTYLPQNAEDKEDAKLLNRWERLIKFFRNYGGGTSMISQQPQSVNKKVLNLADTMFAMRIIGSHERKAILAWVKDVIESETELVAHLPKLDTGTAHVWSPSWLKISRDVKIAPRRTFDASKTPEMGAMFAEPKALTPIDVAALKTEMAEVVEQIKQDDPKELRRQIAELKRQLLVGTDAKNLDAAMEQGRREAIANSLSVINLAIEEQRTADNAILREVVHDDQRLRDGITEIVRICDALKSVGCPVPVGGLQPVPLSVETPARPSRSFQTTSPPSKQQRRVGRQASATSNGSGVLANLSRPQLSIMNALAEAESIGREEITRSWLAFIAGASPNSSAFVNNVSRLSSLGLLKYPRPGSVAFTDSGRSATPHPERPLTPESLITRIEGLLTRPQFALLDVLWIEYPKTISRKQLAERAKVSWTSSAFVNNVSALSSRELIEYPEPGMVRLRDWVMLK